MCRTSEFAVFSTSQVSSAFITLWNETFAPVFLFLGSSLTHSSASIHTNRSLWSCSKLPLGFNERFNNPHIIRWILTELLQRKTFAAGWSKKSHDKFAARFHPESHSDSHAHVGSSALTEQRVRVYQVTLCGCKLKEKSRRRDKFTDSCANAMSSSFCTNSSRLQKWTVTCSIALSSFESVTVIERKKEIRSYLKKWVTVLLYFGLSCSIQRLNLQSSASIVDDRPTAQPQNRTESMWVLKVPQRYKFPSL